MALTVAEGTTYNAMTGGVERVSGGGSSFVKTGDGEMVVQKVSDGLVKIDVRDGVLRLRQDMISPFSVPANLCGYIEDPSFEAFSDTTVPSPGLYLDSTGKHGWKTYGSHEKGNVAKWQTGGGYFNMAGIPYPDGIYVGVLHIRGGLQTTVTLPADGVYRLSYWVAQRPNYKGHEHRVLIDGMPVAEVKAWDSSCNWHLVSFRLPRLAAGEHTLVLASDDNNSTATRTVDFSVTDNIMSTGNLVALVDDFHVDWIEPGDGQVAISNASFEVTSFSARGYEKNPEDLGGWVLGPVDETNYVVLEQTWNGRPTLHPASDGCRILNLVNQVHVGQDVTFPKAGTYTLTLVAGSAAGNDIASYPGKLRFMLGETEIGALELQTNGKASIMKTFNLQFAVPEANYTARLYIANIRGGSIVSVDDIRISAFEPGVNVVAENSFASTGWSVYEPESDIHDGSGKVEWLPQALSDVAWGPVTYGEDGNRAGIRNNASIWRTVAFPAAGTYRLSVASIGRFYRYNDSHLTDPGILTRYSGNAFNAWVAKGGVTNVVGTFGVDDRERFVTHRFLFELPEGGNWEVGFSGLKESEHKVAGSNTWYSNGGVLDGLVIEKVTAAAKPGVPETVEIDVAERAVLALDYLGTNKVAAVRYAGRNYSGEINAVTCPAFITGAGVLYVQPKGTVLMFR